MAAKTYVSKHDGLMVKTTNGRFDSVYRGGVVPSDADPGHLQVLLERGLVEEGDSSGGLDVDPDAAPPFKAAAGGGSSSRSSGGGYDGSSAPAKSGSKADWVDWAARVEGVDVDSEQGKALAEHTRDDLAAAYADRTPGGGA